MKKSQEEPSNKKLYQYILVLSEEIQELEESIKEIQHQIRQIVRALPEEELNGLYPFGELLKHE